MKRQILLALMIVLLALHVTVGALAQQKRRIVILPFQFSRTAPLGTTDIGEGVSGLLSSIMWNEGTYALVDKSTLYSVLREQNLGESDRMDASAACKIGKILAADAVLVGSVTKFGVEGSNLRVTIEGRLLDVHTSELLKVVRGSAQWHGTSVFDGGGPGWSNSGSLDMRSPAFAHSAAGEATLNAVQEVSSQLVNAVSAISSSDTQLTQLQKIEGKIADITGSEVILNIGTVNGLQTGDNLQVERVSKTISDPETGKILKQTFTTVGFIKVTNSNVDTSSGHIVSGAGLRVGDTIRKTTLKLPSSAVNVPVAESKPQPMAKPKIEDIKPVTQASDRIRDKWALVVGISKFANPAYNLRYAAKDAQDFYNYLINEAGFRKDHVLLLLNEKATQRNIEDAFGDNFLPSVSEPGDMVVVYVSTHGTPAAKDKGGRNYIVAYDTNTSKLYSTGVKMDDLYQRIKEGVKTDRALIIMDTCFSGAGIPGAKGIAEFDNFDAKQIAQGCGHRVITSSSPNERSWESRSNPNGVFTKYLLQCLRANQGRVDVKSAFVDLQERVAWEVKNAFGASQTPQLAWIST